MVNFTAASIPDNVVPVDTTIKATGNAGFRFKTDFDRQQLTFNRMLLASAEPKRAHSDRLSGWAFGNYTRSRDARQWPSATALGVLAAEPFDRHRCEDRFEAQQTTNYGSSALIRAPPRHGVLFPEQVLEISCSVLAGGGFNRSNSNERS